MTKCIVFLILSLAFSTISNAQSWIEYQANPRILKGDSTDLATTHTLDAFIIGKSDTNGLSINMFCLATEGWGEVIMLPSWSKETKIGFISLSLGGGIETATASPRLAASIFYQKNAFESLFFWEQGTNTLQNSWHLGYATYKFAINSRLYYSIGLHSQKTAAHGIRLELGTNESWKLWIVLGKVSNNTYSALIGLRYYI